MIFQQLFYVAADQTAVQAEILDYIKSGRALYADFDQIKFSANLGAYIYNSFDLRYLLGFIQF